ncbi:MULTISPECIES: YceI family protein [Streptomyces]|uniref:YceI family protein n=1 Tax=Streptomyces olivaceus TaxID=47716 RepID=A0ABS7WD87_STROV|nr:MULTISPECIES: YceI family protein [Streptomyces]MBZ6085988.1 YceI family protein [Streptomyces olivaceus]MBZ6093094.1 YceI family protein [Streptomyces olivaceus]MBZ6100095.1 YceI family protein [Streptomyces olivaceus]MBZ6105332.1 YceI family protein [Streptomyces olivaceus]MBZ6114024.1 YceI family protein [Streptomyces olivaceus]
MGIFSRRQTTTVEPPPAAGPGHFAAAPAAPAPGAPTLDPALRALTGQWSIDRPHSRIGFSVRHAMVTTVRGAFTDYDSALYFDGARPSESRAELVIRVASVDTGVEQRDGHLVGKDFFDARRYPEMTFRSTSTVHEGGETFRMTGDLTIRDTTRPVELQLDYLGSVMDPFGYERAGFDGTTTIDRRDWGLVYNQRLDAGGSMVSEKVRLQFDISAIRTV